MSSRNLRKGIVLVVAAGWLGLGCELIVDFDRTKIPVDATDSSVPEGGDLPDTFVPETSTGDAADASDASDASDADAADADDAADGS